MHKLPRIISVILAMLLLAGIIPLTVIQSKALTFNPVHPSALSDDKAADSSTDSTVADAVTLARYLAGLIGSL